MQKIIKCKPVDMVKGKFDIVEAILKGDVLTDWLKFKWVEVAQLSKNPDSLDTTPLEMCDPTFAIFLQDLKKHYFPKNVSHLQKAYLCNHIKKPNKLSIKNTTMRLLNINSMLAKLPALGNTTMADDELCNILY
eukprot:2118426-Ditylum_brightwellii.AAC.1